VRRLKESGAHFKIANLGAALIEGRLSKGGAFWRKYGKPQIFFSLTFLYAKPQN